MTKSTITRERLEELSAGQSGFNLRIATHEESQELARIVLAAMGSEPVYQVFEPRDGVWVDVDDEEEMIRHRSIGGETRTLYTAPVAPDEITIE
ncbi:TPA: hypothetical protein MYO28_002922 [Klebsiella pneumoniae]|nr:hypothetical protein [Klebsiella pneumoniae]